MTDARPLVVREAGELRAAIARLRTRHPAPRPMGLVPTMGYLHEGHASLIRRARAESDVVVVSIFVNPTQFAAGEDFATYPRDLDRDLGILARERADIAFVPEPGGFYPRGADTSVTMGAVAEPLEGASRPGHFRGVATVVTMLLNAAQPDRAYFGEKDWQQLQVVRRLVRDLMIPVEIVGVPTTRESDGLAMSSRNVRLAPSDRAAALCIPRALRAAGDAFATGERNASMLAAAMRDVLAREPAAKVDYAVVVDAETLQPIATAEPTSRAVIAARVGSVRLIDNSSLATPP